MMWYGCSIPVAVQLDLAVVDIAHLAHAADECIFCCEGLQCAIPKWLGRTCFTGWMLFLMLNQKGQALYITDK